ncbi:MAG TPA: DNA-directed RNA polymerase subunit B [Acidobacteriota bacterium]|nr:DNA-directed RNA polymerase subunit B [Acidobacteriota bacterium]
MAEVFLNGKYVGDVSNPQEFRNELLDDRRKSKLNSNVNVFFDKRINAVFVESAKGRLRRPLIVVKGGQPLVTDKHLQMLQKGELHWVDLIKQGLVEYLDAAEEENALVAFTQDQITNEHTHLEVAPIAILGLCGSYVPFANHSPGARISMGAKNQKQALGLYVANYLTRFDTDVNVLATPQTPIVRSIMHGVSHFDKHPAGQNYTVAVMSYQGFNLEDAIVMNKGSIERGLGRSFYYNPSSVSELRYSGGLMDQICVPDKDVRGYRIERDYRFLEEDGIVSVESEVGESDVIIGRTSPPRFLSSGDEYNLAANQHRESSLSIKPQEGGRVDFVLVTENEEGNKLVQVRMRQLRIPEVGDKFTSRHGQKGIIGLIVPHQDMPFSASGVVPDLLFSPNGIPSRMTMSHVLELVGGKAGALTGRFIDGTTFNSEKEDDLRSELANFGFRDDGTETFYNGITGERYAARIFVGNMYYMKLKHMVSKRLQSRARGPIQLLTRQPTEGRAKEGGLRLGEMEKDTLVAHGASMLLKERFDSDKVVVPVSEMCGIIATDEELKKKSYSMCPEAAEADSTSNIEVSYAFKLLLDELKSMGIYPRLHLKNKY